MSGNCDQDRSLRFAGFRSGTLRLRPFLPFFLILQCCTLSSCTRQFDSRSDKGRLVFRPAGARDAVEKAEPFIRAYLQEDRRSFQVHNVTRWKVDGAQPSWAVAYSDLGVDTGVSVEIEEGSGKGRVKNHLGNVLLSDNTTFGPDGATDAFRSLSDFRVRLAQQEVDRKKKR